MTERAILHVDMDAFYASVEVLDDPRLRGRPVIVGGTPEGRGVVSAASYEARAFGVHSAMSAARARQLCPDGVFLRGRMDRYVEVSGLIHQLFRRYTPLVEPLSIDEAFLDVTGCRRLFGPPEVIGRRIKEAIAEEVGLTASVGVAPNKFLAKLASDLDKPDGFVVFHAETATDRLAVLPVSRLWGVGKVAENRLAHLGIETVADLLACPVTVLRQHLGDQADHLRELAVGHDTRPVVPVSEARSIGNEVTFAEDIDDDEHLREVLDHLVDNVARRLRAHALITRTVTLKARYPDFTTVTRSHTLGTPTDATVELRRTARHLLADRLQRRGRPLRLIGFTAGNLGPIGCSQGDLFAPPAQERDRRLDTLLDEVHARYGPKLQRGSRRGKPGRS